MTDASELRESAEAILRPLERWAHKCHAASVALIRGGMEGRVARGHCDGVGVHSWLVVGRDVYAHDAVIVDPTLWSYDAAVVGVWVGSARDGRHRPQGGAGTIWTWGKPAPPRAAPVALAPDAEARLSDFAKSFLRTIGPLDATGWMTLMASPVRGWPAAEIVEAMDDTRELAPLVPIDLLGMLTDRNPDRLYQNGPDLTHRWE